MKEPGCVLSGANVHAAYTQVTFAEVRQRLFLYPFVPCDLCILNYIFSCMFKQHFVLLSLAGASSDEGKQAGVMVEFDDGDRGKISLPNIRLLPPGYQICCRCLLFCGTGDVPFHAELYCLPESKC